MKASKLKFYGKSDLEQIPQLEKISPREKFGIKVVASVLPFKINNYVLEHLIDWEAGSEDPLFQLSFVHEKLLKPADFSLIADAHSRGASALEIAQLAQSIRARLNPHPSGQLTHNVPTFRGVPVQGIQHKYKETVLIFPAAGQSCFTFCSFCFRWPQFVGESNQKFRTSLDELHLSYIASQPGVSDVLVTGGDPMMMKASVLAKTLEPFLEPRFAHVQSLRIGTKVLTYWPYRFTADEDADELLRLFEKLIAAGKHVALMAHFNHPREITEETRRAIRRLQSVGVVIRTQSPLLRHINDDPVTWTRMWNEQVRLGCIPYYMFIERDTGPRHYFEVPLARAYSIFTEAHRQVSGLAKTVRGPVMSAFPGKVAIQGILELAGKKHFILNFLQARDPAQCNRPFLAPLDEQATWFDQLSPQTFEAKGELEHAIQ